MKNLYQFATVRQIEYLDAIEKHGGKKSAAKALNVNPRTIEKSLATLKAKAAQQLPQEHDYTKAVPDGYTIKGISQFVNSEGKIAGQWIKTGVDDARRQELLEAMVATMCADIPKLGTIKPPQGYGQRLVKRDPYG